MHPTRANQSSGLLSHFCAPVTAESIASSLMSIRLVFAAFVLTIFAVLLRIMPNNPLHPTRANQSSGLLSHFCPPVTAGRRADAKGGISDMRVMLWLPLTLSLSLQP